MKTKIYILKDYMEYEANCEIYLEHESWYESWTGQNEYETIISLKIDSYKEIGKIYSWGIKDNSNEIPYFGYSSNNDGDYLKMKFINSKKLFVEVGHCCIRRSLFLDPCILTKMLFEYGKE